MTQPRYPDDFIKRLKAVVNKRPKTVIDHILEHGHITTEELKTLYGYNHPPRAARDVREEGVPLETFRVKDSTGRSIGAYRFADPTKARFGILQGRHISPKAFKTEIIAKLGRHCTICLQAYEDRYLQVDHRVPFEVSGDDVDNRQVKQYMLLCGSCNRAKSWSCEHCLNWTESKISKVCAVCYWASPENYTHVSLRKIRRLDVVWTEDETKDYDAMAKRARKLHMDIPEFVKSALKRIENPRP